MEFCDPAQIELLVLDVDGVLTAGEVVIEETGRLINVFNVQDGSGIKYWQRSGGKVAIISGRQSPAVPIRAKELGIELVFQGALKKLDAFRRCLDDAGVRPEHTCCMGDDLPDLPLLRNCGYPVAVANAVEEVKQCAAYVTQRAGGSGAVRETIEKMLSARGQWTKIVDSYLEQKL